ncbi:hypothetical protein HPB50_022215 [Hyalomma asiaticum]|uniref:Uncharacterized protein n=1 Tax=Hyalomma asiaticum TaxID=266040 RepID=A0ACB7S8Q3_HYAAI|nr:hypothetical protein HPB50_022215 [Hyalomma asiaticum]
MTTRHFCILPLTSRRRCYGGAASAVRENATLTGLPPALEHADHLCGRCCHLHPPPPPLPSDVLPPPATHPLPNTARRALTSLAPLQRDVVVVLEAQGPLPRQREPAAANEAGLLGLLARNDVRDATALPKKKRLAILPSATARLCARETAASDRPGGGQLRAVRAARRRLVARGEKTSLRRCDDADAT